MVFRYTRIEGKISTVVSATALVPDWVGLGPGFHGVGVGARGVGFR